MPSVNSSGWSTPLSSSTTISSPPSPSLKSSLPQSVQQDVFHNPRVQASNVIEFIAAQSKNSSAVYIYDVAEQVGFGTLTKAWSKVDGDVAPVLDLQTRAGAGLSLVGRLSGGTSHDTGRGAVLTAYTTPNGLAMMAPSFSYLPPATSTSRLVIQVPTVIQVGESLALSPSLGPLASVWSILPEDITIILSATPQQAVDFATLSYRLSSHVIHLFDHHSSGREFGHSLTRLADESSQTTTIAETIGQAGYSFFEYAGDASAHTVIVLLNGPLALAAKALAGGRSGLGVVTVNVLRPWDESSLRTIFPSTVVTVHVLDDVPNVATQGYLYADVFSALWEGTGKIAVRAHRITPVQTQQYITKKNLFAKFIDEISPSSWDSTHSIHSRNLKKLLLFSVPQSPLATLSHFVEDIFLGSKSISSRLLTDYDVFSKPGGIAANRILLAPKSEVNTNIPIPFAFPFDPESNGEADFLGVLDQNLLKTHSVINFAKHGSTVLIVTSWSPEEFSANVPADVISLIISRDLHVSTINAKDIASRLVGASGPTHDAVQNLLVHLAFLRLYLGDIANEDTVLKVARGAFGESVEGFSLEKINAHGWSGLEELELIAPPASEVPATLLKVFDTNAIAVETESGETIVNGARLGSWHDAAKHLLFPEVYRHFVECSSDGYAQNPALRPEIPDRTYLVTCTVNKRLTPLEYDRNVFHLEFDTSGTGLKYAIGEALGVHGWNDERDVLEFCAWYNTDPNRLITIPVVADEDKMHTRTVLQALQQQIDLFGRPPKSFYTDLAEYASNPVDRHALLFIGSPEGVATFKKLSEKDTVTFVDVLKMYSSAKPSIERLCEMIGDIKPRHYSIASAQSVVGDRVDLLVVTVDWVAPSGTPRYGQCTRYLAGLKIGQKVTVSIKPSVMKLPPSPKQPIIMAGLGTGAAPFRAFLQHLAWLAGQGEEIGPVYYYFGSRHQASEYLYGEEIEAFVLDGVITRAGLAFSRDTTKKVYIQHKMLEDSEALAQMLHDDKGVFYLCGPTWPVPDVYEALVNALVTYKGSDPVRAGEYLESLKEEERYVLEVY